MTHFRLDIDFWGAYSSLSIRLESVAPRGRPANLSARWLRSPATGSEDARRK